MIDHIVSTKLVNCAYYRFRMIVHYLYVAQFAFYIQTGFLKVYFTIYRLWYANIVCFGVFETCHFVRILRA